MGNTLNTQNLSLNEYSARTQQEAAVVRELNYLASKPTWQVTFKEYTDNRWKKLVPLIKRTGITSIKFEEIKSPDLFASFIHIEFNNLTRLQLSRKIDKQKQFISTRYKLLQSSMRLNQSHSNSLDSNRVLSLRPLRKLHAPQLKALEIYENIIAQAMWLNECNFNPEMEKIVFFSSHHMIVPECYNWLVKMKTNTLDTFEYYSRRVIDNTQMKAMVKQRYPSTKLFLRYDRMQ